MNRIEANASVVNRTIKAAGGDVTVTRTVSLDYNDLINKPDIPDSTSDLINDSGFISSETDPVFVASAAHGITSADIANWNGKSDFSGSYTDLTDKPTIPTVPSQIVNTFNGQSGAVTYTAPVTSVNGQTGAVVIGDATTSSAGLMSATDKSHLDDVYADYSSALTALGVS